MHRLRKCTWLVVALSSTSVAAVGLVRAAEEQELLLPGEKQESLSNSYRVGLACGPVSEALAAQLGLSAGEGLLVQSVLEGSPAEKAGLQRFDVLTAVDKVPLATVAELVRAVNRAETNELTLQIIRRGEQQSVKIRPELRPEDEMRAWESARDGWRQFEGLPPEVGRYLRQFENTPFPNFGREGFGWRQFRPGIVVEDDDELDFEPSPPRQLPDNFSMRIEKSGEGPAKIHVRRGDEKWEVTEDNLDQLPDDLRDTVKSMLGRNQPRRPMFGTPPPPRRSGPDGKNMDKRFDEMSTRLKELQNAIESLRSEQ